MSLGYQWQWHIIKWPASCHSMNVENRPLVTHEPVEIHQDFRKIGKLPIVLEESIEYTSNLQRKIERLQHVTGWTWGALGYRANNLPGHCSHSKL